jgi:periplasmic protein TonB
MSDALDRLLEQRRARRGWGRRLLGVAGAALLHVAVVGGLLLGPRLFAEPAQPVQYVPVQLVPAPALGTPNPAPPRERPTEPVATPPPEPAAPPAPEPEPDAPALPDPEPAAPAAPRATPPPARPAAPPEPGPAGPPGPRGAAGGNPESPFTASVGGVDNPSFTYGYYLDRLLLLVRAQWTRPQLGSGPAATIHFRILRDGRVEDVELVTSSGYSSFDLAALRAVQGAAPFPPLPRSYRDGELGVNLIFR